MKFYFDDNKKNNLVKFAYKDQIDNPFFQGNLGENLGLVDKDEILLGLGDKEELSKESFKKAIYDMAKELGKKDIKSLSFARENIDLTDEEFVLAIAEAIILASYNFDYYKSEKSDFNIEEINFSKDLEKNNQALTELENTLDAQKLSRDIVNLRSNDIYPESLANRVKEELEPLGVEVKIYQEEEIRQMGLSAYLEVAKGSENRPRFIVMEYLKGEESEKPLVFVGKGLTYDSGGYSLKSSNGMKTMHCDMGGSGTVIGAMKAIAQNELKVNVVALVAACENLLSGKSYKPGDVIKARNGMTIEVDNTDAEGRITLADAVNYGATEYQPQMIVDLATLTGAVLSALGETYTGAVTNNEDAFARVMEACKKSDEKIWQLPNDDQLRKNNESKVADIKNSGGPLAGSITAGQFVGAFVEDYPWVHLDIAGTAYLSKAQGLYEEGATGVHVKTLYNLAKSYSK